MTTARMTKTVTAGVIAQSLDVAAEFGTQGEAQMLVITNRSINEVGVNIAGGTAGIDADDTLHIVAGATRPVRYPSGGSISYIASAANSKVEVAAAGRTGEFMR